MMDLKSYDNNYENHNIVHDIGYNLLIGALSLDHGVVESYDRIEIGQPCNWEIRKIFLYSESNHDFWNTK
jgi:hypothetical protein